MVNKSRIFHQNTNPIRVEYLRHFHHVKNSLSQRLLLFVPHCLSFSLSRRRQPALDPSTAHLRPINGAAIGPEAADFFGPNDPLPGEPGFGEAKVRGFADASRSNHLTAKNQ